MGVKEFKEYLSRLGYQHSNVKLQHGSRLLIDAMQWLICHHHTAVMPMLENVKTRKNNSESAISQLEAKLKLTQGMENLQHDEMFFPNGNLKPEAFKVPAKQDLWIIIREKIIESISKCLVDIIAAGVIPILVWDPPIIGKPRTAGKKTSLVNPLVLRNVDKTYIYAALKYAGFPSVVSWTEGEKCACAAVLNGSGDAVLSTDTDCIIFGTPLVADSIRIVSGISVSLYPAHKYSEIKKCIEEASKTDFEHLRLIDAAVFLGCDFCPRLKLNGPATLAKHTYNNTPPYISKALNSTDLNYVEQVKVAINFFSITHDDRKAATFLINVALSEAWSPSTDILESMGILNLMNKFFHIIRRGSELKPNLESSINETSVESGVYTY